MDSDCSFSALTRPTRIATEGGASSHELTYDQRSAVWTINGGYLAATMLRAVGDVSPHVAPANLTAQFLRPVMPGAVDVTGQVIRQGSGTELHEVRLSQGGKLAVLGHVWTLDGRDGPLLRDARMPLVPHPEELQPLEANLAPAEAARPPFFAAFDDRPINRLDFAARQNREPRAMRWLRYRGDPVGPCLYDRAARALPLIDMLGLPAATNAKGANILSSLAPTILLSAQFYDLSQIGDWLLGDGFAESAGEGLISSRVKVWSQNGALAAQGLVQVLTKPGDGVFVGDRKGE